MTTAVYLSRFAPALSVVNESEAADSSNDFNREMTKRLLQISELLGRAELFPIAQYESPDKPVYGVRTGNTGLYTVVGKTPYGDSFLMSRLIHEGSTRRAGGLELLKDRLGEVELGIFSGDREFVDCVKSRMEYRLPPWIESGKTKKLELWTMEDNYAIALSKRFIFS